MNRPEIALHVRALLIAVGLYAVAALVWLAGPLLTVGTATPLGSERARVIAVVAALGLFVAHALWRAWRSAQHNRQLMDGLAGSGAAAPGAPELAVLGQRFAEAVAAMRNRRVGGAKSPWALLMRRPYVYELPWYILIGAPGAGKTTTIVNSGLEFPFAAQLGTKALRGVGGTRNCDWWFTADAVLIDTAGRYTTQDSYREADRAAWFGFLGLLARHRPRQPINGAILTLSVTDLLNPGADKRKALAREMRGRIEELHQQLGIRFPIYVLVTKTDLLAGFGEFFVDFDKDERAQVWGVTFPVEAAAGADVRALTARLGNELTALEKTLNECLIDRLREERDRDRRSAIFAFPQQWRMLRESLVEMLEATFGEMAGAAAPLVRGVYFTSATQEGSPIDRALGGLARSLGLANRVLPPARPSGKSFFVTRLLREVILGEAGLAGTNRRWERRRALLHGAVMAATALVTVSTLALAWYSYSDNRALLLAAARAAADLKPQVTAVQAAAPTDLAAMVPLLDAVHAIGRDIDGARSDAAPVFGMGLDQRAPVAAVAGDAYFHLLRESLLPRIAARLAQRLQAGSPDHVEMIYEALKAYLMLFGGKNFDAVALRAYLSADWNATLAPAMPAAARDALRVHLDRLLASGEVGAPAQADAALVERSRDLVASVALMQRVYNRLKQIDKGDAGVPFTLQSAGGPAAGKVLLRASGQPLAGGVPALYTRAVWQQSLRPRVHEVLRQFDDEAPWVLGPARRFALEPAARAKLTGDVEAQYGADYLRTWDELVRDLRLVSPRTLAATAELAQLLSRPDSPLLAVLGAVLREVNLATPAGGALPADTARPAFDAALDQRFGALRQYVMGQPAGFEPVHALLGRLATQLAAIDDAVARKAPPPASDALRELPAAAAGTPEPVRSMLQQLASTGEGQVFAAVREPLARLLAGEVGPGCARATEGRYPFVRGSAQEVTREAFTQTFAAGGLIDGFFQRHLAGHVDTSGRAWSYRALPNPARPDGADGLLQFQRAQAIRNAFFQDGGRSIGIRLQLKLLELDPGIAQFVLDVDGQAVRFTRESRTAQLLQWPGAAGAGRVTLKALGPGAADSEGFVFDGPWALLRLFDRVRIEPGPTPAQATLVFDVEGRKAQFEARSAGGAWPIGLPELESFQCPRRL